MSNIVEEQSGDRMMRTAREVAQLAQMACVLEVCAPKPGNVNCSHNFADSSLKDYLLSAIAIGPSLENSGHWGVGRIIWQSVSDTHRFVGSNTNLGIILLLTPLVKAYARVASLDQLRQALRTILETLTVEDARSVYAAIRLASPGGLGKVSEGDVADEPSFSLLHAMNLAQERDSIAREYATGFSITFDIGLPALKASLSEGAEFSSAVVQTYLTILSRIPDTLIARKTDIETARRVSLRAKKVINLGGVLSQNGRAATAELDKVLRDPDHSLNPGTTADLTAAAIFLTLLESEEPVYLR